MRETKPHPSRNATVNLRSSHRQDIPLALSPTQISQECGGQGHPNKQADGLNPNFQVKNSLTIHRNPHHILTIRRTKDTQRIASSASTYHYITFSTQVSFAAYEIGGGEGGLKEGSHFSCSSPHRNTSNLVREESGIRKSCTIYTCLLADEDLTFWWTSR